MKSRLLIVDDESEIREALARHFRFLDYDVELASNGAEALEVLEREHVDVIISDILMPVMNGVDLLREVRKGYPMIHMIMITGYVNQENVLACVRHGADRCVFKPWETLDELEKAVADAMESVSDWRRKLHKLHHMKPE